MRVFAGFCQRRRYRSTVSYSRLARSYFAATSTLGMLLTSTAHLCCYCSIKPLRRCCVGLEEAWHGCVNKVVLVPGVLWQEWRAPMLRRVILHTNEPLASTGKALSLRGLSCGSSRFWVGDSVSSKPAVHCSLRPLWRLTGIQQVLVTCRGLLTQHGLLLCTRSVLLEFELVDR